MFFLNFEIYVFYNYDTNLYGTGSINASKTRHKISVE